MADFDFFNSSEGASMYGNGCHVYKLLWVKWLTLENEKKNTISRGGIRSLVAFHMLYAIYCFWYAAMEYIY